MDHPAAELKTIRVALLDDHEIVRRGLVDLISSTSDITVAGEAGTVAEGDASDPGRAARSR